MSALAGPGWPRPWLYFEAREWSDRASGILPVPWVIAGTGNGKADWTTFHDEADRAHIERLCQVCGERMDGTVLLGVSSYTKVRGQDAALTSGPGMHPRCCALAIKFCPHFTEDHADGKPRVYRYDGSGRGYYAWHPRIDDSPYTDENRISPWATPLTHEDMRCLAKTDPLGLSRPHAR